MAGKILRSSRIFAVVVNVGDTFVINPGGVFGFGSESLQKSWVTHVLWLQNLDGNVAQNYRIMSFPDLTHATDGDSTDQAVALAIELPLFRLHRLNTALMTLRAMGAAKTLPLPPWPIPPPSATITTTATCGLSAGAKPANQSV